MISPEMEKKDEKEKEKKNKDEDYPYASLAYLCIISKSQEDLLRHCPFAAHDDFASEKLPLESSAISMASPTETLQPNDDSTPHEVYHTPLEQSPLSQSSLSHAEGNEKSVDLGKNVHLGLHSEVPTPEIPHNESVDLGESSSKKLKFSGEPMASGSCSRTAVQKFPVQDVPIGSSVHKDEMAEQRRIKETFDSGDLRRLLPPSITGVKKDSEKSADYDAKEVSLLDVLKIIIESGGGGEDTEEDKRLSKMSILDIAKSRGMTFPRPSWWPEGGFN